MSYFVFSPLCITTIDRSRLRCSSASNCPQLLIESTEIALPNCHRPDVELAVSLADGSPLLIVGDAATISDAGLALVKIIKMTRSELIANLAQRFPQLLRADAEMAVSEILGAIVGTLSQGHRVEIRGFGTFGLNFRPPRNARNPKTGEKVSVPGKQVPHFKAGKELRKIVNRC